MEKIVLMLAIAWVPQKNGTLKEVWRMAYGVSRNV